MRNRLCCCGLSRGRCRGLFELIDLALLLVEASENLFSILVVCGLAECGSERENEQEYRAHESTAFARNGRSLTLECGFPANHAIPAEGDERTRFSARAPTVAGVDFAAQVKFAASLRR